MEECGFLTMSGAHVSSGSGVVVVEVGVIACVTCGGVMLLSLVLLVSPVEY